MMKKDLETTARAARGRNRFTDDHRVSAQDLLDKGMMPLDTAGLIRGRDELQHQVSGEVWSAMWTILEECKR